LIARGVEGGQLLQHQRRARLNIDFELLADISRFLDDPALDPVELPVKEGPRSRRLPDMNIGLAGTHRQAHAVLASDLYLPPGCAVHLGIDLNVPAGTPVLTPLSGRVIHAMPCQALGGGWGGWFVLRADTPRCGAAYLVFGHLAHRGLPPLLAAVRIRT
jgi:hypothetical protein